MLFLQWKRKSVDDTKEEFTVNTSSVDRVGAGWGGSDQIS
jgi:hypothetical protein